MRAELGIHANGDYLHPRGSCRDGQASNCLEAECPELWLPRIPHLILCFGNKLDTRAQIEPLVRFRMAKRSFHA